MYEYVRRAEGRAWVVSSYCHFSRLQSYVLVHSFDNIGGADALRSSLTLSLIPAPVSPSSLSPQPLPVK